MRLRRTIGLKKDEYHLDRKHITCAQAPAPMHGTANDVGYECAGAG